MNTLPTEIAESISYHLDHCDISSCLTVNKSWYSLFIHFLYYRFNSITFRSEQHLRQFLESIVLYPRCIRSGIYINRLNLTKLKSAVRFQGMSGQEIDIVDALANCPNLKELTARYNDTMIDTLMDPRMPIFKRLKCIDIHPNTDERLMECYYRYRSSLMKLRLYSVSDYTPDALIAYIASFPRLDSIRIRIPSGSFDEIPMLDKILEHSPKLRHIRFTCDVFTTLPHDQSYPLISILELSVNHLYLKDSVYLKNRFPSLKFLVLIVRKTVEDEVEMLNVLMELKHLIHFEIISRPRNKSLVSSFWKSVYGTSSTPVNNKLILLLKNNKNLITQSFKRCRQTGTKTLCTQISCPDYEIEPLTDCLMNIGGHLSILRVGNHKRSSYFHLDGLNTMCPALTELHLMSPVLSEPRMSYTPNLNLRTLSIYNATLHEHNFRIIEQAYPMLRELKLIYNSFRSLVRSTRVEISENEYKLYTIQLPETELKQLTLAVKYFSNTKIVVVNEVKGVVQRAWYYSERLNTMVTVERSIYSDIPHFDGKRVYILKSSTLEQVSITRC
ncbi:hypothetical protein BDB01DRAFT_851158 [Pilobolus umbonatus]|nr:hypothetical protein BDB01DRAFT_851158 [Pilobolus umbonatus]